MSLISQLFLALVYIIIGKANKRISTLLRIQTEFSGYSCNILGSGELTRHILSSYITRFIELIKVQ